MTAFVHYLWQKFVKMQVFCRNSLIYSRRSHCPGTGGWPWGWEREAAPFGWRRRDVGCSECLSLDSAAGGGSWFCAGTMVPPLPRSQPGAGMGGSPAGLQGLEPSPSFTEGIVPSYLAKLINSVTCFLLFPGSWEKSLFQFLFRKERCSFS